MTLLLAPLDATVMTAPVKTLPVKKVTAKTVPVKKVTGQLLESDRGPVGVGLWIGICVRWEC